MYKNGKHLGRIVAVWLIFCYLLDQQCTCQEYSINVEWASAMRLVEYKGYKSVSLTKYQVPEGCKQVIWDISADGVSGCPPRQVLIYLRHGSYPLATPYNETFPENFMVEESYSFTLSTNNISLPYTIQNPKSGSWYLAGFLPKEEKKMTQAGLSGKQCGYWMGAHVITQFQSKIEELSTYDNYSFVIPTNKSKTLKLDVAEGTISYTVAIDNCTNYAENTSTCPFVMMAASNQLPTMSHDPTVNCSKNNSCHLIYMSPTITNWNYITIVSQSTMDVQFDVRVLTESCIVSQFASNPISNEDDNTTQSLSFQPQPIAQMARGTCILQQPMGRLDLVNENFFSVYMFPNQSFYLPVFNLKFSPDQEVLLTYFDLLPERHAGGTLTIEFITSDVHMVPIQDAVVFLCMMKDSIPSLSTVRTCKDGVLVKANTTSESAKASTVYIPYPTGGRRYLGINSMCINKQGAEQPCYKAPIVSVGVSVTRCVDHQCGGKGNCKDYISGMLLFSSCDCLSGWQGYGCTDGTNAQSDGTLLTTMLLLTLSNAFFLPGIFFSIKRKMFVEGLVYVFTMFFSTFYHACDVNNIKYTFCMMDYQVLSYCDFYGSIMSFWVTLLAMSRLGDSVRSFFHMLGALALALGVEYDRHGLWVFITPALTGLVIMSVSWVVQCRKRKGCYPSKWRYLKFILPGILLAGVGLVIFAFLETEDNYKYTHSAWHVVIALSIVFLIPSRKKTKGRDIQSDDSVVSHDSNVEGVHIISSGGITPINSYINDASDTGS